MQKKAWMTSTLFKRIIFISKRLAQGGTSHFNFHLLILNGHGSHVLLEVIKDAQKIGLGMLTLPPHFSHFIILDVSCFKPFKIAFKKEKRGAMVKNNYLKPNKITLVGWVDKALNKTLPRKNFI
jgi:hypothetical protein